ncbi:MAG: hypothetical protein AAF512_09800, partial [Pseudomonadota bacterium]
MIKRRLDLITVFAVIAIYPLCHSAYATNGEVAIAYPAEAIQIDGQLADWPAIHQAIPITRGDIPKDIKPGVYRGLALYGPSDRDPDPPDADPGIR